MPEALEVDFHMGQEVWFMEKIKMQTYGDDVGHELNVPLVGHVVAAEILVGLGASKEKNVYYIQCKADHLFRKTRAQIHLNAASAVAGTTDELLQWIPKRKEETVNA